MTKPRNFNNVDVKRFNKSAIFRIISESGKVSQQEIAAKLAVSIPTVVQNVRELIDAGLVLEVGAFESTGGRKAKALAMVPDARFALGLDITERYAVAVAVDLAGEIVAKSRINLCFSCGEQYFAELGLALERFVADRKLQRERILGLGVSIPGIVGSDGAAIDFSQNLGIAHLPCETIARHFSFPSLFINDANAAGFAEFRRHGNLLNAVYLSLCFSVGGSMLLDGQLYTGDNQRGGEIGHAALFPGGVRCHCGKRGCLDAYCSSKALVQGYDGSLEDFFRLLDGGDEECRRRWDSYAQNLAVAVDNLHMVFDADVIIGGTVGWYLEGRDKELRARLAEANAFGGDSSYYRPCHYQDEAAAVGAAMQQVAFFETNL